jgi:hypothetical protein
MDIPYIALTHERADAGDGLLEIADLAAKEKLGYKRSQARAK